MKNLTLCIITIMLCTIISCAKNDSNAINLKEYPGGDWIFNSNTYQATTCTGDSAAATLTAYNTQTGSVYSNIVVYFYNALPDTNGSYVVVAGNNISAADQVSVSVAYQTSSATTYYSSLGGAKQTAKVTVAQGKVSISGMGINIASIASPTDTIPLSFSINQTQ